ncbi:hypothetical protein [Agromyces sp. PvR057]|uniref:hypothetical protein n=1 Tax=Agromyces sp. PvR057 TaxID=3156403 RepID=UPI00339AF826
MTLDAGPRATDGPEPSASGQRRFWAYALYSLGAIIGACVMILAVPVVARIAETSALDEYGRAVSLAWMSVFEVVLVVSAAVGAIVALLGLAVLRGYRRGAAAYVLIGLAVLGLIVAAAALLMVQAERGFP